MGKKKDAKKALLESRLALLPADAGDTLPGIPVAVALREARTLAAEAKKLRKQIVALPGFDAGALDGLPLLAAALADAEADWKSARLDQNEKSLKKVRKEAEQLRSSVMESGRYLCRYDARAQRELDQIAEGEGLPDLLQDLSDLARFWDAHKTELTHAVGLEDGSRARLNDLQVELGGGVDDDAAEEAQVVRNRLALALAQAVSEVRAAARYLLRDKPKRLADFASAYDRARDARRRKAAAKAPAPVKVVPTSVKP